MYLKAFISVLLFSIFAFSGHAQECTLGISGETSETLRKVFQLSSAQVTQMEAWSSELAITNRATEEAIQELFDTHPQSTPDELTSLAQKYKGLQQKMVTASAEADTKLLTIFNELQYGRYLELCKEAFRAPIKVIPIGVKDTIVAPE